MPQSPQTPNIQSTISLVIRKEHQPETGGGEAPAAPHNINPPWKLAENTQSAVDLRSSRDSPQSTKLKHPSPVKQAW